VPPEYASSERLSDAWLDGFDRMAQSLRGLVIDTKKRTTRKPVEPKQAKPVPTQARKVPALLAEKAPLMAAFEELTASMS
jgi:hypothetical protein